VDLTDVRCCRRLIDGNTHAAALLKRMAEKRTAVRSSPLSEPKSSVRVLKKTDSGRNQG
jgi:hypothetical protein